MDICTWLAYMISFVVVGEGFNCAYPRIEDGYDSEGMACSWIEEDFYYDEKEKELVLFPNDNNDNYFEAKARKRYWEKRSK